MKKIVLLFIGYICAIELLQAQNNKWWNETVFYEVFVRSYFDSNSDGIGDFKGLMQKLDYLNDGDATTDSDLGIKALWLMPIMQSPSYHGYDVSNYKAVQNQYGSSTDFKNLVQAAHQRGIKIVIDFVINHSSDQHPWFQKSANNDPFYKNFYRWTPSKPSYTGPWGQEVWHAKNSAFYYGLFWSGMPDLNYQYAPLVDSIMSAADFWLDSMNVDGFRLDAAMYLYEDGSNLQNLPQTISFWKSFNDHCKTKQPNMMTVGEVWSDGNTIKLYNQKLDYCFEFNIATALINGINAGDPTPIKTAVKYAYENYPFLQYGLFLTNHDQNRVIESFGNNQLKNKAAAALYLSLPGVPYLYYGEEIGMSGTKPDESIRRPMQWTAGTNAGFSNATPWYGINSNYRTMNVLEQKKDSNSLWHFYKNAIQNRNKTQALQTGTYKNLANNRNGVYSFLRQKDGENIVVICNLSNNRTDSIQVSLLGTGIPFQTTQGVNLLDGKPQQYVVNQSGVVQIEPLAAYQIKWIKLTSSTSLQEPILQHNFQVFPNPSSGLVSIVSEAITEHSQMSLFDSNGKKISTDFYSGEVLNQNILLNIEKLSSGIYNLTIDNLKFKKSIRLIKVSE